MSHTHQLHQLYDNPRTLTPEERAAWHRDQETAERAWLDEHARIHLHLRPYTTAA